jgi:hypothetical protein
MRTLNLLMTSLWTACLVAGVLACAPVEATVIWVMQPDPALSADPAVSTNWLPEAFRCCPLTSPAGIDPISWRLGDPQAMSWSEALHAALPRSVAEVAPAPEPHYLMTIPVVVLAGLLAGALRHVHRGR